MNAELLRQYCLEMKGVSESFPFDEDTLVFKVMGKVYALFSLENDPLTINLKCDPEKALELREAHAAVEPGYHMNKKHWNTITIDGSMSKSEVLALIDHSYEMVCKGLTKKLKAELAAS